MKTERHTVRTIRGITAGTRIEELEAYIKRVRRSSDGVLRLVDAIPGTHEGKASFDLEFREEARV